MTGPATTPGAAAPGSPTAGPVAPPVVLPPVVAPPAPPVVVPGPPVPVVQAPVVGPAVPDVQGPVLPRPIPTSAPALVPVRPAAPVLKAAPRSDEDPRASVLPVGAPLAGEVPRAGQAVRRTVAEAARVLTAPARAAREIVPELPGLAADVAVPEAVARVAERTITRPALPLGMIALVVAFVLVQNRIDRRDPKLAQAPVEAEPLLEFRPLAA